MGRQLRLFGKRREEIQELERQLAESQQERGNLLALIHRDGGQYLEHGWTKAQADAVQIWAALRRELEEAKARVRELEEEIAILRTRLENESIRANMSDDNLLERDGVICGLQDVIAGRTKPLAEIRAALSAEPAGTKEEKQDAHEHNDDCGCWE